MRKFLLVFAIIGMISFTMIGCSFNTGDKVNKPTHSKIDFWNTPRKGANFMNSTSLQDSYQMASNDKIQFIRLAPDKWAKDRAFLFEDKPDRSGRDFLMGNADQYQGLVKADLEMLKKDLDIAQSVNMKVVITMLSLPGDRWRQFNHQQNDDRIWEDKKYQEQAAQFWQDLASHLKNHPAIVGYNIINEPHPETVQKNPYRDFWSQDYMNWYRTVENTPADLNHFYQMVVKSIREVDQETPIILDVGLFATPWAFKYLKPVNDLKVLYAFHMYEPFELTSQREPQKKVYQYPGIVKVGKQQKPVLWDKSKLEQFLNPVREWAERYHVPSNRVIAEEFGINRTVPGAAQYLQDLISIFNDNNWHWSFYAFREDTWTGMDYELGTEKIGWSESGDPKIIRKDNPLWDVIKGALK
jgi:endoglucanase